MKSLNSRVAIPLVLAASLVCSALSQDAGAGKGATPAKPTLALFAGGADEDLKVLRESLQKLPALKFNAKDIEFGDFKRDDGLFTKFFTIEIADLAKTDIGAIAKAVVSSATSRKDRTPPALFLIVRYKPGSTKNEQLRDALAKVKGVDAKKSWAGDQNIWISVDGSGQGNLAEILRALHGANIPIRNPITDIRD